MSDNVPEKELFELADLKVGFTQEGDGNVDGYQEIDISVESCGGGFFYVLKTDRWAVDSIDEFVRQLTKVREGFIKMGGEIK